MFNIEYSYSTNLECSVTSLSWFRPCGNIIKIARVAVHILWSEYRNQIFYTEPPHPRASISRTCEKKNRFN